MSYHTLKKEQDAIKMKQSKNKNEALWIKTVKAEGLKETWGALLKKEKTMGKNSKKIQENLRTSPGDPNNRRFRKKE